MENKFSKSRLSKRKKKLFRNGSAVGFHYRDEDEIAIELACRNSEKWMNEKYGKGAQPHRLGVGDI